MGPRCHAARVTDYIIPILAKKSTPVMPRPVNIGVQWPGDTARCRPKIEVMGRMKAPKRAVDTKIDMYSFDLSK